MLGILDSLFCFSLPLVHNILIDGTNKNDFSWEAFLSFLFYERLIESHDIQHNVNVYRMFVQRHMKKDQ